MSGTTFGYTGQRFDEETGLYYYKNRYYSPTLGVFLQPDPIGYNSGDLNLYKYVMNDPLNLLDPLGLRPADYYNLADRPIYYNYLAFSEDYSIAMTHGHLNQTVSGSDNGKPMSFEDFVEKLKEELKKKNKPVILAICFSAKDYQDKDGK
ncbi:MAG: RHS repeat-associated core domain-containing protein [Candidatus Melainabacteria bacterium]|nr:RHS repeat-associated core domain-containing protein [Candidatus Melainabacteria bacterium]